MIGNQFWSPADDVPAARFVDFSQVQSRGIEWLWPERIPIGAVTLVVGDPGLGKSQLTLDLAARLSRGDAWPDKTPNRKGKVLLLNAEDSAEEIVYPRLVAARADLSQILALRGIETEGSKGKLRSLSLLTDLHVLDQTLAAHPDCRLVVIDPVAAYLSNVDGNRNGQIRQAIEELADLAEERRVAVMLVSHLNKRDTGRAIYRAIGALAFVAATRAVWAVIKDPHDSRNLFMPIKLNYSDHWTGIGYRLQSTSQKNASFVAWDDGLILELIDDLLEAKPRVSLSELKYQNEAIYAREWLEEILTPGEESVSDVLNQANRAGISKMQLHRASKELGVIKSKDGFLAGWSWQLPDAGQPDAGTEDELPRRDRKKRKRESG